MGERRLAGSRDRAAADDRRGRRGVVRCPERRRADQPGAGASRPAIEWMRVTSSARLVVERRQDPGQPPGEHRLADPGRAGEQQVVAAGGGDLEHAPRALLAAHVAEVGQRGERSLDGAAARRGRVAARRGSTRPPRPDAAPGPARCRRAPPPRPTRRRRRGAGSRSASRPRPRRAHPGTGRSRPSSASSPTAACPASAARRELARGGEHRERDRQVEARPLLAQVGGREVDGDPAAAATRARPTRCRSARAPWPPGRRGRRDRRSRTPARRAGGAPRPRPAAARGRRGRG